MVAAEKDLGGPLRRLGARASASRWSPPTPARRSASRSCGSTAPRPRRVPPRTTPPTWPPRCTRARRAAGPADRAAALRPGPRRAAGQGARRLQLAQRLGAGRAAFAAAAVGREVLASIPVGIAGSLIVARVPVEPGSAADGSTVASGGAHARSRSHSAACRVLALVVGDQVRWTPAADGRRARRHGAGRRGHQARPRRRRVRRGGTPAAERSLRLELAHHQEVRQPEGVEGRVLGGVEARAGARRRGVGAGR